MGANCNSGARLLEVDEEAVKGRTVVLWKSPSISSVVRRLFGNSIMTNTPQLPLAGKLHGKSTGASEIISLSNQ